MTRLLLDTHLLLWWLGDDPRLPREALERVRAPKAEVFVSQARRMSIWRPSSISAGSVLAGVLAHQILADQEAFKRLVAELIKLVHLAAGHCRAGHGNTSSCNSWAA